jgi:uncharacterized protein
MRSRTVRWGAAVALLCAVVALIDNWLPYALLSHYKRGVDAAPAALAQVPFERFEAQTADGEHLVGWYVAGPPAPVVIVLHRLGSTRQDVLDLALAVRERGFPVVAFDLRGHGESSGEFFTYGAREWRDVAAVIDWLAREHPAPGYALVGVSAGGAVAAAAAAHDPRVTALVTVGAFADLEDTIRAQTPWLPGPWRARAIGRAQALAGFDVRDASPARWVAQVAAAGTPVLVAHGTADAYIPYTNAERLGAGARLFPIAGAGHGDMVDVGGAALLSAIAETVSARP